MPKRPSLADSMRAVQNVPEKAAAPAKAKEQAVQPKTERPEGGGYFAATRQGMKRVTFSASPENHRRLKRLSVDSDTSIENLMAEALDDLFKKKKVS